jgi:hypothetical protein
MQWASGAVAQMSTAKESNLADFKNYTHFLRPSNQHFDP